MTTILGIDLGKFKSVFCLFTLETGEVRYDTIGTDPTHFQAYLERTRPKHVLFETSTAAGWVSDLCDQLELNCDVVDPRGDAWKWSKLKRKTDRDDAYKLIQLFQLGTLPTVHMPPAAARAHRKLILFRHRLIERRTAICNHIRSLFQAHGLNLPAGPRKGGRPGEHGMPSPSRNALPVNSGWAN
jgi:transposase